MNAVLKMVHHHIDAHDWVSYKLLDDSLLLVATQVVPSTYLFYLIHGWVADATFCLA